MDGELLKPDAIIGLIWPGVTLESLVTGQMNKVPMKGNVQSSGMTSGNIFLNLS